MCVRVCMYGMCGGGSDGIHRLILRGNTSVSLFLSLSLTHTHTISLSRSLFLYVRTNHGTDTELTVQETRDLTMK